VGSDVDLTTTHTDASVHAYLSHDGGVAPYGLYESLDAQTWQALVFPSTVNTSTHGIAFDATGTLYVLRASRLYSRSF